MNLRKIDALVAEYVMELPNIIYAECRTNMTHPLDHCPDCAADLTWIFNSQADDWVQICDECGCKLIYGERA